ncbi:MAG TPA: Gfo/Idh/MocA family oxidoreductase [Microbacterium sp.]|nr:Gfo/Idh/MocA family oxidoreductase [Microbacterium sp.]
MTPPAWPLPQTPGLRDTPALHWGIAGAGAIAHDWVCALHTHTSQRVHAVTARDGSRAARFAATHGIPRSYGSYADLADDPDIDAVYVATTTEHHLDVTLELIAAGKPVLVEKPLGSTAHEAARISDAARDHGVYARENMWTLDLPQTHVIDRLIADGVLGDLQLLEADFSAAFDRVESARVFAPSIGAGALLDIGIYPLAFARHLLGAPLDTHTTGVLTDDGVDARAVVASRHGGGALSISTTALDIARPNTAAIIGTRARIEFATDFYCPAAFDLVVGDQRRTWHPDPAIAGRGGLCYPPVAMAADILAGRTAHPGLTDSVAVLETIDRARRQLGVTALVESDPGTAPDARDHARRLTIQRVSPSSEAVMNPRCS